MRKKKPTRYFHFSLDTPTHELSGYISGTDTLLGVIEECTSSFGYGVEFVIREVREEEYLTAEENDDDNEEGHED